MSVDHDFTTGVTRVRGPRPLEEQIPFFILNCLRPDSTKLAIHRSETYDSVQLLIHPPSN